MCSPYLSIRLHCFHFAVVHHYLIHGSVEQKCAAILCTQSETHTRWTVSALLELKIKTAEERLACCAERSPAEIWFVIMWPGESLRQLPEPIHRVDVWTGFVSGQRLWVKLDPADGLQTWLIQIATGSPGQREWQGQFKEKYMITVITIWFVRGCDRPVIIV